MHVRTSPLDLQLRRPFTISRGTQTYARNLLVEIAHGNRTGIGEAGPDSSGYYGETREIMQAALDEFALLPGDDPMLIEDRLESLDRRLHHGNSAAKSGVDMALHDLVGKTLGIPLYRLFGLNPAAAPVTSFTISIDTPEEMARQAAAAAADGYPILKIKLGTAQDIEIVAAIREVCQTVLRVDANAAWTPKQAINVIEALVPYGIELVEQPVAAEDLEGLRLVRQHSPVPIIADESCRTASDIPRVASCVDGINIKLAKCGGLRNAVKMIHVARAHQLKVMLGLHGE